MKYGIVSRSSFEGFQSRFRNVSEPFLVSHDPHAPKGTAQIRWSAHAVDAILFNSEQDAWTFAFDVFGMYFTKQQIWVVVMHEDALKASAITKSFITQTEGKTNG